MSEDLGKARKSLFVEIYSCQHPDLRSGLFGDQSALQITAAIESLIRAVVDEKLKEAGVGFTRIYP